MSWRKKPSGYLSAVMKIHGKKSTSKIHYENLERMPPSPSLRKKIHRNKRPQPKSHGRNLCLGGGNSNMFGIFIPYLGKTNPIWLIFIRWVGSTTNQLLISPKKIIPAFSFVWNSPEYLGPGAWLQRGFRRAEEGEGEFWVADAGGRDYIQLGI